MDTFTRDDFAPWLRAKARRYERWAVSFPGGDDPDSHFLDQADRFRAIANWIEGRIHSDYEISDRQDAREAEVDQLRDRLAEAIKERDRLARRLALTGKEYD